MPETPSKFRNVAATAALFALTSLFALPNAASAQETRWVGVYYCEQQGVSGLTLTITQAPDNRLTAIFEAYSSPANAHRRPAGAEGSSSAFEMNGVIDLATRALRLNATRWIREAPAGYEMPDFVGEVSASGQVLTGALYARGVPIPLCTSTLVRAPR